MSNIKPYIIAAVAILLFLGGGFLAWTYQQAKIDKIRTELVVCHDANKTNEGTITRMSKDREQAETTCEKRLEIQRKTAEKLRKIDNLGGEQNEKIGAVSVDPVLAALNGLFSEDHR